MLPIPDRGRRGAAPDRRKQHLACDPASEPVLVVVGAPRTGGEGGLGQEANGAAKAPWGNIQGVLGGVDSSAD